MLDFRILIKLKQHNLRPCRKLLCMHHYLPGPSPNTHTNCCQVLVTEVKADYVFEVQVDSFQNPTGQCLECQAGPSAPAGCCDNFRDFDCPTFAPDFCDTYFIFCLREFGTSGDDDTLCPLGRQETPGTIIDMGIELMTFQLNETALIGLPNPLSFNVPGNWPGRVQLLLVAMDRDPQIFQPDEVVARFLIQESLAISVETEFTAPELFQSMFANITLRFRVMCADGFNGPNCETVIVLPSSVDETISTPGSIAILMATSAVSMEFTTQVPPPVGRSTAPPSLLQLSTPPIAASPTSQTSSPLATTMSTPDETVLPTTSSLIESMTAIPKNSQNPSSELLSPTGAVSETPTLQGPTERPTDTMIPPQESSTACAPPVGNTGSSSSVCCTSTSVIAILGAVGGLVATLSIFVLIVGIIVCVKRKQGIAHHNIFEMTGNEAYIIANRAKELTIPTSQNEAYGTAAHNTIAVSENETYSAENELRDEVTTSQNEAYGTAAHNIIENEAYSTVNELRDEITTSQNEVYPDQAPDEYDYVWCTK